ncbi:MAG TPA: type II toxin-antitoxin system HipA family toxin, partial [Gammaproteobacteria bacterium]|nr:type II toxin-antitoxin system HipA family toxin [Gammaproteobacteria bacterium]
MAEQSVNSPANHQIAQIILWGAPIGAVSWDAKRALAVFEYEPAFRRSGIELAPLTMPLATNQTTGPVYSFPALNPETYHGLPGLLADSLPDKFGNAVIDAWLVRQGIAKADFSPLDRLCYIGTRGMGALEFRPANYSRKRKAQPVAVDELVALANEVLSDRAALRVDLDDEDKQQTMNDSLQVGVSAGGARAKAIIAWNPETNEVRSGQVKAPDGFGYWLLKFDGVTRNRDKEALADPQGYGLIEYAYYLMATAAGINMAECRLLKENGRHHFMARRFDRTDQGEKLHMQTLCGIAHYDFNAAGAYGYEQALAVIETLKLGKDTIEQQFRRMVFNVAARNQDDHTKNIAFLMNQAGRWSLSPAYDVNLAFNPHGQWTHLHQMSVNGKRKGITRDDFLTIAQRFRITKPRAINIIADVENAIVRWPEFAKTAGVSDQNIKRIGE